VTEGKADFSRDLASPKRCARHQLCGASFRDGQPVMSISLSHSTQQVTVAEIDLRFLQDFLGDTESAGWPTPIVVDSKGQVLASSSKGPDIGKDLPPCRRSPPSTAPLCRGKNFSGHDVLTADAVHGSAVTVLRAADRAGADCRSASAGADRL